MDPYGRDFQPNAPKFNFRPLRPFRRLVWWMLICDLGDYDKDMIPYAWESDGELWGGLVRTVVALVLAFAALAPFAYVHLGIALLAIPAGLLMWPVRVWARVALSFRSGVYEGDDAWKKDLAYEALKDRMWHR